ncbi:MAG: histidine phosphatase family protein [Paracoccaceae bacterium]
MAELILIRHGQAAFGSDNYDQLTDLGQQQSAALKQHLDLTRWHPDCILSGTMVRHAQTLKAMQLEPDDTHAGFNEYDFHDLLSVRFGGQTPKDVLQDRKTHFRILRDTILDWQDGGLEAVEESWNTFTQRTSSALAAAMAKQARRVLIVTSGGVIGQLVATTLNAPSATMVDLNLQVKNTSVSSFVFSKGRVSLNGFNATPHFDQQPELLSYS